jgi:hypothetical protein
LFCTSDLSAPSTYFAFRLSRCQAPLSLFPMHKWYMSIVPGCGPKGRDLIPGRSTVSRQAVGSTKPPSLWVPGMVGACILRLISKYRG